MISDGHAGHQCFGGRQRCQLGRRPVSVGIFEVQLLSESPQCIIETKKGTPHFGYVLDVNVSHEKLPLFEEMTARTVLNYMLLRWEGVKRMVKGGLADLATSPNFGSVQNSRNHQFQQIVIIRAVGE